MYKLLITFIFMLTLQACNLVPVMKAKESVSYQVIKGQNSSIEHRELLSQADDHYVWLINQQKKVVERKWLPVFQFDYEQSENERSFADFSEIFPFEVGKEVRVSEPWYSAKLLFEKREEVCRVDGEEQIEVPAGTFATYKVSCWQEGGLQLFNSITVFYLSPDYPFFIKRISAKIPFKPQTVYLLESFFLNNSSSRVDKL